MKNVIFLVEDSFLAIKILKKGLGRKYPDCEIVLAENFEKAKRLFDENKKRIAVVLSDINIPKNEETTREGAWGKEIIKKSLENGLPTICISGSSYELPKELKQFDELFLYESKGGGFLGIVKAIDRLTDLGKDEEPKKEMKMKVK